MPKDAWKWENNTKVTMRFGDQHLGNWNKDIGFLEEWKEFPEAGLVAMRCTLNFDVSLLNYSRPLAYKYLIYVPQDGKRPTDEAFEFLHNAPSKGYKPINRCLVIPMAKCKAKGIILKDPKLSDVMYDLICRKVPSIRQYCASSFTRKVTIGKIQSLYWLVKQ